MPVIKLTTTEARRVKAKRAKDKARNAVLMEVVDKLKQRLKDPTVIEADIVTAILNDVRKMVK